MDGRGRSVWAMVFILTGFIAVAGISHLFGPREVVAWRRDWDAARAEARAKGKPVFLYFTLTGCPPCEQMRRTTWADRRVADALTSAYVPVKLYAEDQEQLARAMGADGFPWYGVVDDEGRVVKRGGGYANSEEFLAWLRR